MRWRWLQFLRLLSYSLYLSHKFVTGASFRVGYLLTRETIATEIMWSVITKSALLPLILCGDGSAQNVPNAAL
jgi:peptidoglycan/LPS O-acetylase OafA/YrhL